MIKTCDKIITPHWLLIVFLGSLAGFLFISSDSLWIDEGNTAYKALQGSLGEWWTALVSDGGSDAQMPGYMLFVWAWAKLAGTSEFALRLSNLVWLLAAVMALRSYRFAVVALLSSAFVLYYANELRPYLMQIAATAVVIGGLRDMEGGKGWWQVLLGCLLLCASSLTGVIWAAGILLFVLVDDSSRIKLRWFWRGIAFTAPLFGALGIYYLLSLLKGQGPATMGGGLFTSLGAVAYELLGLMGLGPGRIELRINPKSALSYAPVLIPAALIMGSVPLIGAYLWFKKSKSRRIFAVACGIALPIIVFTSLIFLNDFRLLGRHLSPLSVLLALCVAQTLSLTTAAGLRQRGLAALGWAAIFIGVASASQQRFSERHRKDDYRLAASMAKHAMEQGREVLWLADRRTGEYYGIKPGQKLCKSWHDTRDELPSLTDGIRVVLGKPDIADPRGRIRQHLEQNGFRVTHKPQAFTVWEKN